MTETSATVTRKALAAAWAVANMDAQGYANLCQQFIENAYGTTGQYPTAIAASNRLMKRGTAVTEAHGERAGKDPLVGAEVGDLVFFAADPSNQSAGHVGVYLGGGEMVSALPNGVQRTNILKSPYWTGLLLGTGSPPPAWSGPASTPALEKGAQQLLAAAQGATPVAEDSATPLKTRWDAAQKAVDDALAALNEVDKDGDPTSAAFAARKNLPALQKAEREARDAYEKASKTPSAGSLYLNTDASDQYIIARNPDGTIKMGAEGKPETIPNPNYRPPAGSSAAELRAQSGVLGAQAGLYGAQTQETLSKIQTPEERQAALEAQQALTAQRQAGVATPEERQAGLEASQAQTEGLRQTAALNKAKLDLLTQAQQEVQAAIDQPAGPDRLQALEAIGQKYATINDPTALLDYLDKQAQRRMTMAESLAKQTGFQFDPGTMQRVMDEQGQPKLTESALQARMQTAQTAASEATRSAQAMLPYLAPPGTGEDLAALGNAIRTGGPTPEFKPRTGQLPAEYDPTKVGQQVFQSMLQHLAPGSQLASQLLQSGQTDPNALNQPLQGQAPAQPAAPVAPQDNAPISELLKRYGLPVGPTGTGMALPEQVAVGEG